MDTNDYVAKLNLYSQKIRAGVTYEDVKATGPDHIKTFVIRAIVNGVPYPDGEGKSKKEAKQNAAKNALKGLLPDPEESRENPSETSVTSTEHGPMSDYVSWLNKYGQEHRLSVNCIQSTPFDLNTSQQFCCRYTLGNTEYEKATGTTKKEAKQAAAKKACDVLSSPQTKMSFEAAGRASPQSADNSMSEICSGMNNVSLASDNGSYIVFNYIGKLQEYCQRKRIELKFINEQQTGPPHNQRFFVKAVIGDSEYPVGEGGNLKEAKQNAARLACNALDQKSKSESMVSWTSSGVGSPIRSSTPQRTVETPGLTKTGRESDTGSSIVFADTPSTPKVETPDTKPKIKLAANFKNAFKLEEKEQRRDLGGNRSTKNKQTNTRFKSDFDSIEPIDKGAFGRVFKANDKLLESTCAVKIVAYKDKKTLTEVKALSELGHKHIVRYYHCWTEDSRYHSDSSQSTGANKYLYIKMELCDKTLRWWIDDRNKNKPSPDPTRRVDSLEIALQIIRGVEYFHSKKFIHRDLKPANIMFGKGGEVKIGDFGLVTDEIDDDSENQRERTMRKGTETYMAPEQEGSDLYDRKVDIFSLGLIYFELFWSLNTRGERAAIWPDVRQQKLPQGFSESFRRESNTIKAMLSHKPTERPEASIVKTNLKELHNKLETGKRTAPDVGGKTINKDKEVNDSFESKFDQIERLGKGAFGRVYKAREKLLDLIYAIKIVANKDNRPLKEAKALSELSHPNIVRYYNCWLEDSLYQRDSSSNQSTGANKYLYIKMELCDKTLREWIEDKNANSAKRTAQYPTSRVNSLEIALQIISGVEYFHSKKFIHRDLKPANIMFGQGGEVKIGDFGLVADEIDDDSENQRERTMCRGTKAYMAPEQERSYLCERKVDIFSLGLIYFELFWNISLSHETKEIWQNVRSQKLPQDFAQTFHFESKMIKAMLCPTPDDRPEAKEVHKRLKKLHELRAEKNEVQERRTC